MENPKVACTTIKRVLQLIEVDGDESKLSPNVHDRKLSPLTNLEKINVNQDVIFHGDEFFRFSFVRNPFTRILSAYLDKIAPPKRSDIREKININFDGVSFKEFLNKLKEGNNIKIDIHWVPQHFLLQPRRAHYHFIGRFEYFQTDFQKVIKRISPLVDQKILDLKLDYHGRGADQLSEQYIGKEERDLILKMYEKDFLSFGYGEDPRNFA